MHVLITGGHSGIGLELTKQILDSGHRVGWILRSKKRADSLHTVEKLRGKIELFYADLSIQEQVRAVAKEITQKWKVVDILFNNAAVLLPDIRKSSQDNEMHFEVNTLAPYLLTTHLKTALQKAEQPKVINTVSDSMANEEKIDFETLLNPHKIKKLFGSYLQSKLALSCLMNDLASNPAWATIKIINVTPGANKTPMTKSSGMPKWLLPLRYLFFKSPQEGATLIYKAAFDKKHAGKTGIFLKKNKEEPIQIKITASEKDRLLSHIKTPPGNAGIDSQ